AEHMLSHYWEMDFIAHNRFPELHGIKVGVATPIIAEFFEELADILPESSKALCPPRLEIEALLQSAGCPISPIEIGIDRELFLSSLLEGYEVRPRYSIMRYAKEQGRLEAIAHKITNRIYGEA
ncbi:MAG: sn-glycerol-1-phosphate dehydrogenase, partial [Eubacterium sp.]